MDAIALVRPTRDDPVQEDDLAIMFLNGDVGVAKVGFGLCEVYQLMIMRGEQGSGAEVVVDVFGDRPGERDAIEGACPSADLVEDDQTSGGCVVEDVRRLGHLDHERALATTQLVGGSHAGEEAINHADLGPSSRHEAPHLGENRQQRHLTDIGGFARHVRPGDEQDRPTLGAKVDVVRHEGAGGKDVVEDGMTPAFDLEDRFGHDFGATIAPLGRQFGQTSQNVELRQNHPNLHQPRRLGGDPVAEGGEQLGFEGVGTLLGVANLVLVLLQFGSDVAFGVLDGLLANEFGRNLGAVAALGVADLNVVAEDVVEADLEAADSGPANLLGLILVDPGLATVSQLALGVEVGVVTVADQASLGGGQGGIIDHGRLDPRPDLRAKFDTRLELGQQVGRGSRGQSGLDPRQEGQRPSEVDQVTRRGAAGADSRSQAFEVTGSVEGVAEVNPQRGITDQFSHGVVASGDRLDPSQRGGQPAGQQPSPHRRAGLVDRMQERPLAADVTQGPGQFQTPPRHLIERHDLSAMVGGQAIDVADGVLLRIPQVSHQGPSGLNLGRLVIDTEPAQGLGPKLLMQDLASLLWHEVPRRSRRDSHRLPDSKCPRPGGLHANFRDKNLGGIQPGDLIDQFGPAHPSEREMPGRKFHPGQTELAANLDDGRQVVGRFWVEKGVLSQSSSRDDPNNFSFDDAFGQLRIFDLLADRDPNPCLDQLGQVCVERRVGESGHLAGVGAFVFVAGSDCEAKQLVSPVGVVTEHLVKVAHPEEQERFRISILQLMILPHHRRQGGRRFAHGAVRLGPDSSEVQGEGSGLELVERGLFFVMDLENLIEPGDPKHFKEIGVDAAKLELAFNQADFLLEVDQLAERRRRKILDVAEVQEQIFVTFIFHQAIKLVADFLDIFIGDDLGVDEADNRDPIDILKAEMAARGLRHRGKLLSDGKRESVGTTTSRQRSRPTHSLTQCEGIPDGSSRLARSHLLELPQYGGESSPRPEWISGTGDLDRGEVPKRASRPDPQAMSLPQSRIFAFAGLIDTHRSIVLDCASPRVPLEFPKDQPAMIFRRLLSTLASLAILGSLANNAAWADDPTPPIVFDLTLKGTLGEEPGAIGFDGTTIKDNLKGVIDRIGKAKADPAVKGLLIRFNGLSIGLAKGYELQQAITDFRTSGKRAFAYLESAENADYVVATAADEIVMPESGWLMLKGVAAEVTFYKSLFDKLGVKADWMQVGQFKSYGEPFTRTEMSKPFREELVSLLDDNFAMIVEAVANRQGIKTADARALIDNGPYSPEAAKAAGLVNRIRYADAIETELAADLGVAKIKLDPKYGKKTETIDLSGFAGFMKMIQMLSGEGLKQAESKNPKVALIYAQGGINTGKSTSSLWGDATMGSDTVIKHLREAEKNETVKAIVLRVDSPGGSALASDLIWREVVRINKPIVASMSDVAASGGYYISMGADKIFAEPGTLTGSIGVTGGKFVVAGLMDKLGVATDTITVGQNGTLLSPLKPFSASERAAMQRLMDDTYRQFVSKAAQGRKMTFEQLDKLAGGRVYTGRQAQKLGLVDELGTLGDAINAAKVLAELDTTQETELLILPKAQGVLESLINPLEDRDVIAPDLGNSLLVPTIARPVLARLDLFRQILGREPVMVALPFEIKFR